MSLIQAYLTRASFMKPLTKIRVFRFRLAVVLLAIYWIAIFTGTHLPKIDFVDLGVGDKTKHFTAFFGLTSLICYVSGHAPMIRRILRIVAVVLCYAIVDEWTQGFVPGRVPDRWDFVADAMGMAAAIAFYATLRHYFGRRIIAMLESFTSKFRGAAANSARRELSAPHQSGDH